jgi:hypothetical protein
MPSSRVVRIDQEVWEELQRRARPFEDTPNSVIRRLLGLSDDDSGKDTINPRIGKLLDSAQELVGRTLQVDSTDQGYGIRGRDNGTLVAYVHPQRGRVRIVARKEDAEKVGLTGWDREQQGGVFGEANVRWYIQDDDDEAHQRAAVVLSKLWNSRPQSSSSHKSETPAFVQGNGNANLLTLEYRTKHLGGGLSYWNV